LRDGRNLPTSRNTSLFPPTGQKTELQWKIKVRQRHGETGHVSGKELIGDDVIKEGDDRKIGKKVKKTWLKRKRCEKISFSENNEIGAQLFS
jgi:hypothetical protein